MSTIHGAIVNKQTTIQARDPGHGSVISIELDVLWIFCGRRLVESVLCCVKKQPLFYLHDQVLCKGRNIVIDYGIINHWVIS